MIVFKEEKIHLGLVYVCEHAVQALKEINCVLKYDYVFC